MIKKKLKGLRHNNYFWRIFAALCAIFLVFVIYILLLARSLPALDQLGTLQIIQSTKIYDRTEKVLLYEISSGQKRTVIPLDQIPEYLREATITIEDENFYTDPGFSWRGYLRAAFANLRHGEITQGGSTISQQLAKIAFLTPEQTYTRKLKELMLSIQLNRHYSKDKILELYLNQVPYGLTIYGVEAASQTYFGKPVKDITLPEAALLAAMLRAPSFYSPWGSHQEELFTRQRFVLQKMHDLKKITKEELDAALQAKIVFATQDSRGIKAPHFVLAVQEYLAQKYGEDMVMRGGLKVITTLDWELQQKAETAVAEGAKRNTELYRGKNAALLAQDPKTGQVLAVVGSRDYFDTENEGNFNVATQGLRQPGSALKPFVYLSAMEKGYTPDTVLFDVPTEFSTYSECPAVVNFSNENKNCFHPENYEGTFRGPVSLRTALAQSINIPAVKTLYLAGLPDSIKRAQSFGLKTLTDPSQYGLSLVLGGGAVKLADLVNAYSVLAADGIKRNQTMVLEVKNSAGSVLEGYHDTQERVVDAQYPRLINDILSDVDARRGLFQNSLSLTVFPGHDVALKTGTSNDYRDAWTLGYTPSLVVGVWAGNNDNAPMQRQGSSILAALPIWNAFMSEALKEMPLETFTRPDPTTASKPILRGEYLANKEIHSILFYVDRSNPDGPRPENPENDPQFKNWESGVLSWAMRNLPDFQSYNQTSPQGAGLGSVQVFIQSPSQGSFPSSPISVRAAISSSASIKTIRIYFNKNVVFEQHSSFGNSYNLNWQFTPQGMQPQNILEVEAVAEDNTQRKEGVIFYASGS